MKILILICLLFTSVISYSENSIDIIIVNKSERILYVVKDDKIIKKYEIALGLNPTGHKKKEGDKKTPEGYYFIDGKNSESKYFLSLHTSYPNFHDKQVALKNNLNPGEHIAIHGLPSTSVLSQHLYSRGEDWTDGCIAINNADMKELWDLVEEGTQILIKP
ncbi:L,D-transpeptidase family protein [Gammaproteobacteria bacterium]|nr:L,D-transpeptidase family protein [Gammaproteobacteria bacterium]